MIDLHVHSTASDGTYTPTELVKLAKSIGLTAFAITDHDSVSGIKEAMAAGQEYGVEVVPGIELSTTYIMPLTGIEVEVHMLGLYINPETPELLESIKRFVESREGRNKKMTEALAAEGFDITFEAVEQRNPDCVIARPHIARYLVDTGQIKDVQTVFDKYIGDGCKCYIDRYRISPMEAAALIHKAGGIAVLAHPCLYNTSKDKKKRMTRKDIETMVEATIPFGLDGIEAIYSCSMGSDEVDFKTMARSHNLIITGGTDFHGSNKPYLKLGTGKGSFYVDDSFLTKLKEYYKEKYS